jgi:hypothetical protein
MAKKSSIKDKIKKKGKQAYNSRDEGGLSFTSYLNLKDFNLERFKDKKAGEYIIDIIPYEVKTDKHPTEKKGDVAYNLDIWVHKNIGPDKSSYLCMKKLYDKPCKICEEFIKLQNEGLEWDDTKHLYPTRRSIYFIRNKNKPYIYDVSFKTFEENWLEEVERLKKKGEDVFPIYLNEEGCRSLEFVVTEKRGIGKYVQFSFEDIQDYNEKILENVVSLEKLLVIPNQAEIKKILEGDEIEEKTEEPEEEIEDDNDDTEMDEEEAKEYLKEAENIDIDEEPEEEEEVDPDDVPLPEPEKEPVKKKKKQKKTTKKEDDVCPYEKATLEFGRDWDEYEQCDICKDKHNDVFEKCKEKHIDMEE